LTGDNFDRIVGPSDREKALRCRRCGPGTVLVHAMAGRVMIQCVSCQWSVFDREFDTAREAFEKGLAA
jgi:hypothetical protein